MRSGSSRTTHPSEKLVDNHVPEKSREAARQFLLQLRKGAVGQDAFYESAVVALGGAERMIARHLIVLRHSTERAAEVSFSAWTLQNADILKHSFSSPKRWKR